MQHMQSFNLCYNHLIVYCIYFNLYTIGYYFIIYLYFIVCFDILFYLMSTSIFYFIYIFILSLVSIHAVFLFLPCMEHWNKNNFPPGINKIFWNWSWIKTDTQSLSPSSVQLYVLQDRELKVGKLLCKYILANQVHCVSHYYMLLIHSL